MKYKTHPAYPNEVILFETANWFITLWENQYYLGRATIEYKDVSKRHLSELSQEHILELFSLIKRYEIAFKKAFNTTNFNWTCLMNNSYKEKNKDNPDPLHIHILPRYRDVVEFNGEVFKDELFAHHYDDDREKIVDKDFLIVLADKILSHWE
ncbi:MAG: HIT family protein [Candidatus Dojkabacteria bacterium]